MSALRNNVANMLSKIQDGLVTNTHSLTFIQTDNTCKPLHACLKSEAEIPKNSSKNTVWLSKCKEQQENCHKFFSNHPYH